MIASARLLQGKFPDRLPPSCTATPAGTAHPVDPADFRLALEQALPVMQADASKACRFRFAPGRITLQAVDANVGSAEVELDAPWEGPEVELLFVPTRVLAVLKTLAGCPLSISIASGEHRSLSITAPGFASWIMPYSEE